MSSHLGVSLPFLSDYYTDGQKKWARRLPLVPFFYGFASPGIRLSSRQINDLSLFDSSLPSSSGSHLLAFPFAFTQSVASDRRRWPRFFPLLLRCYIHQCPFQTAFRLKPLLLRPSSHRCQVSLCPLQRQLSNPRPGESESVPL